MSEAVVAGVDTHADTHYAAVISATGKHFGAAQFPATDAGHRALGGFVTCQGPLLRVGVEGTNSSGASLTRHLRSENLEVVEVLRPARQVRRMRGKSDEIDAYAAAHIAQADNDTVTPKTASGPVEAIRVTHAARRSAIKARTETIQQIKSLLVTAPEPIRTEYRTLDTGRLVNQLAGSRPRSGDDETAACTRLALKRLAARYQQLDTEITAHEDDLTRLVHAANPALTQATGVGTITAAQLLATAGDNPDRIGSEAAFAMLCGAAPIPASSGKTSRVPAQPRRRPGRELCPAPDRDQPPGHRPGHTGLCHQTHRRGQDQQGHPSLPQTRHSARDTPSNNEPAASRRQHRPTTHTPTTWYIDGTRRRRPRLQHRESLTTRTRPHRKHQLPTPVPRLARQPQTLPRRSLTTIGASP